MIDQFRGEYFFLSNMCVVDNSLITPDGFRVPTSEHYYMSTRFKNIKVRERVAYARAEEGDDRPFADGLAAKKLAHRFIEQGKANYSSRYERIAIMHQAVFYKFATNPKFLRLLLETEDQKLVEGNDWGDRFWGVSPVGTTGENYLGLILMDVRKKLAMAAYNNIGLRL